MKRSNRRRRYALAALLALIVAASAYAYTAANNVPATKAGDGYGAISGYNITNVQYALAAYDPSKIASVSFTLDAVASTVKAKLVNSNPSYQDCTVSGGTSVTCTFTTQPTVLAADALRVIAVA
jgi:hypothetical protein